MLAEAYKRIARELKDPDTPLPVALAQLVVDTEAAQCQQWIECRMVYLESSSAMIRVFR